VALILVGIDFSGPAARAVGEARGLAAGMGARIEALYVEESRANGRVWIPDGAELTWLDSVRLEPSALTVRSGTPWVELARHASENEATLVVIGTHGRRGYHPVGLGSTALRLATASTRPVLVVGRGAAAGGGAASTAE
jgi:nucleotide-binding universal stress UspA family protein